MVCRLNQQNQGWGHTFELWRQPTREQCIAEFGAEAGPRLFTGGYHAIEGERDRRKKLAAKPVAAKPVAKPVDPRVTELRKMEAQLAQSKRELALKEEHDKVAKERDKVSKERDALRSQLAARNAPKPRKGIRFSQGFRPFGPKPAA